MLRTVAVIVAAIRFAQPEIAEEDAVLYADALQKHADAHDFDPLTGVSIIRFESNFQPEAISKNGEDFGLAQIRARYIGACKNDPDPKNAPGPECRKVKKMLLDPEENIRVMAELITANRKFCKKKVKSALFARWLASYQGRNNPRKNRWCKPGEGTYKVIRYRQTLLKELRKQGLSTKEASDKQVAEERKKTESSKEATSKERQAPDKKTAPRQAPDKKTAPRQAPDKKTAPRKDR